MILRFIVFWAVSTSAFGLKYEKVELKTLFLSAETVGLVKITGAESVFVSVHGQPRFCGYEYGVENIEIIKESPYKKPNKFISTNELTVGGRYLVFMGKDAGGVYSLYMTMGKKDVDVYNACSMAGGGLFADEINGSVLPVDENWYAVTGDYMLKISPDIVSLPNDLAVKEISFNNDLLPREYVDTFSFSGASWGEICRYLVGLSKK